jgi:GNAT superfamily N-acetyltransferase
MIFASKDIRKEMPYLAHGAGYIWFVARKDGVAIGIAACEFDDKKHTGILHGLYVVPKYRRSGVADQLLRERIAYLTRQGVLSVKATVSPKSLPILQRHRFNIVRPGKEFTVVERSLLTEVAAAEAAGATS